MRRLLMESTTAVIILLTLTGATGAAASPAERARASCVAPAILEFSFEHFTVDRRGEAIAAMLSGRVRTGGSAGTWTIDDGNGTVGPPLPAGEETAVVRGGGGSSGRIPGRAYPYTLRVETACGAVSKRLMVVWPRPNPTYPHILGDRVFGDVNGDGFGDQVSIFSRGGRDHFTAQVVIRDGRSGADIYDRPLSWKSQRLRARCSGATSISLAHVSSSRTKDVIVTGRGGAESCIQIIHFRGREPQVIFDYKPLAWFSNDRSSWAPKPAERGLRLIPSDQELKWERPFGLGPEQPRLQQFTLIERQYQLCPPSSVVCAWVGRSVRTIIYQFSPSKRQFLPVRWEVTFIPI